MVQVQRMQQSKVFALIIGINNYLSNESLPNLSGCVNDANTFKAFLLDSRELGGLEVPPSNIKFLVDEAATRDHIISTFQSHFLNNSAIPDGGQATIIFFYAGHGSRIEAPGNLLPSDGMVETICPHDERTYKDGKYVHSIPDYVLGWLIFELAEKKGRNITLIFDSCHSGGMDRADSNVRTSRSWSKPVPLGLDNHLWKGKSDILPHRLWSRTATNHVLLAACGQEEVARETLCSDKAIRGRFTKNLVHLLRCAPLQTITNVSLLRGFPEWPDQHPQCPGTNQNRLVFNIRFPDTTQRAFRITPVAPRKNRNPLGTDSFTVTIGSIGGVAPDAEFSVYTKDHRDICTLVAHSVEIHRTVLVTANRLPISLPKGAYAVVAKWKSEKILRVRPHPNFLHTAALFPTALHTRRDLEGCIYAQSRPDETPHLLLRTGRDPDEVIVEELESSVMDGHEFPVRLQQNIERLSNIIEGIAHFRYFLELECQDESARISDVALEMHRLMGERPGRTPDPRFGQGGNIVDKFEVQARCDPGAMYGFTLRNNSCEDLFPYLFMFDADDYSIDCWYAPPNVHVGGPLHKQGGTVTLGMGGQPAFMLDIPAGQSRSSGFLKLFVSTTALDLCWIEQESLLKSGDGLERYRLRRETIKANLKWDTIRVAIRMTL
ncbi:caspase domain-containing protein [Mycena epipterygia]|nr:caspase domain-containing protein [Mycena epipterygia]